jgi:hydroxymethylpyrimidine/phosphomethylpyrimidine kinase
MKKINVATVVTIAGSDSSGGAGIQADIKTISALGCYAASVITALTAQNTQGVQAIYEIPADFVTSQIESVFTDLSVRAVKIGMLHDENIIAAVASVLKKFKPKHVILDPVMIAKSGHELLKSHTFTFLKENLFPYVSLITPNIFEAEKLLNKTISNAEQQQLAAIELGQLFQVNVLIKGGHQEGHQSSDVLYLFLENHCEWFYADRINTHNTHGTGCSLSAAIAAFLSKNDSLIEAVAFAKSYLTKALASSNSLVFGQGCGPIDHFYFLQGKQHVV